ncbi:outer membrane beta-barrel protein [Parasphingorhabdus sp. JC815]|uniref:outer membrane beta-barrel protein n=1 Tax=Parasphingorhabdus sp. JC815 TaxID=3232140 RepID=UPI003458469E
MKKHLLMILVAVPSCHAVAARAQDSGFFAEAEIAAGRDIVPPDIIESGLDQDRLEGLVQGNVKIGYDVTSLLQLNLSTGTELYPVDSLYNRYRIGSGVRGDIPLAKDGRTRIRLAADYEYVFGEDGRVFDRIRGGAQLIHRHSPEHSTIGRLRYGYRNQSEERFAGFDQSEWLAELRHNWRPGGGQTAINISLLGLRHIADDDRFSYDGYGFRLTGRTALTKRLTGFGKFSIVQRDYDDAFSNEFPTKRSDTNIRIRTGLEYQVSQRIHLFAEGGYASTNSNIPVRDYNGFIGLIGARVSLAGK